MPASSRRRPAPPDPAALLRAVLSLPADQLDAFLDGLAGAPQVAAVRWCVRECRISPEKFPERNAEIRRRNTAGESYSMLALEDYGLTASGIAKVVQRGRQKSLDAESVSTPRSPYDPNKENAA